MSDVEIDYLEESGPGIAELPEAAAIEPGAGAGEQEARLYPGWERETVEQFLRGTGAGIHMMIGAAEKDWLMTERDLERIAPPLTRIANRWEPALRLSPLADPLLVAHGFALYGWRSALERQRALRDAEAEEPVAAGAGYEPVGAEEDLGELDVDELQPEPYFPNNGGSANE